MPKIPVGKREGRIVSIVAIIIICMHCTHERTHTKRYADRHMNLTRINNMHTQTRKHRVHCISSAQYPTYTQNMHTCQQRNYTLIQWHSSNTVLFRHRTDSIHKQFRQTHCNILALETQHRKMNYFHLVIGTILLAFCVERGKFLKQWKQNRHFIGVIFHLIHCALCMRPLPIFIGWLLL